MDEELEDKLDQDLRRSGFYSEMRAIHACMAAKWECHGGVTYFDKDERTTRECDFEAVRVWGRTRGPALRVTCRLLGQVKKSEKPWIVFVDRQHSRFADGVENIIHTNAPRLERIGHVLHRHSLVEKNGWSGTGIHEAFKKPTDTSRWYSAFLSACKAADSASDATVAARRRGTHFELIKPVVVLDGTLVRAELSREGELLLEETDDAAFAFEYRSDAYDRPRYCLDLVTLDTFPRYFDFIGKRMLAIFEALLAARSHE